MGDEAACNALAANISSPLLDASPLYDQVNTILNGDNKTQEEFICGVQAILDTCMNACDVEECKNEGQSAEDIAYTVIIQVLVFALVFGLAGSVDFGHFKERFRSRGVYIGLACQFIMMPLIGFITIAIFKDSIRPLYAVSLLIICASPGGSYSNWWCNVCNADLALSVAMTTVSTIVSVAVLPINIIVYIELGYKRLDPDNAQAVVELLPYTVIGYTLANVVIAVMSGLYFGYKFPQYMKPVNAFGTFAGFVSIFMGAFASSTSCAKPWDEDFIVYFAILVPVLLGLSLAMVLASFANLPKPQRVAVSIETAYQNTGIALAVSLSLGPAGRAAAIVPVVYGGYEAVVFGIWALGAIKLGWTLSPPDEPLWKVLVKSYQDTIPTHPHYRGYRGDDESVLPSDKRLSYQQAMEQVAVANQNM